METAKSKMLHLMSLHIIHKLYQRLSINRFSLCCVARCRLVRMTLPLCVATAKCLCFVSIRAALSTPLPSVTPLTTQMQYRSPSPAVSTASRSSHKSRVCISCVWAWRLYQLCMGMAFVSAMYGHGVCSVQFVESLQPWNVMIPHKKQFPKKIHNFPQIFTVNVKIGGKCHSGEVTELTTTPKLQFVLDIYDIPIIIHILLSN